MARRSPQRAIALPPSPPIHELASHDLLAAFLTPADETRSDVEAFGDTDASVLIAGCLADPNALAAVGDRAAQAMSVLRPTSVEKLRPGEGARCASAESSPTRTAPLITRAL